MSLNQIVHFENFKDTLAVDNIQMSRFDKSKNKVILSIILNKREGFGPRLLPEYLHLNDVLEHLNEAIVIPLG